ncbi:MAG: glycosyltransferase family 39 protein [Candidatus Aquicultorales bacterium]
MLDTLLPVGLVALVAVGARLLWVWSVSAPPISDFYVYDQTGWAVAQGKGFMAGSKPLHAWGPGYPAFLGIVYFFLGHRPDVVPYFNAALGAAGAVVLYLLGGEWFDKKVGLVAGLALALYPEHIYTAALLASENLFVPLFLGSVLAYVLGKRRSDWRFTGGAGLLLGLAALVRPAGLFVLPALATWELFDRAGDRRAALRLFGVFLAAFVLVVGAWTIRNYVALKAFVPISTSGGVSFWMGNNPNATGAYYFPEDGPLEKIRDPVARDREGIRLGTGFVLDNPGRAADLYLRKLAILYQNGSDAVMWIEGSTARKLTGGETARRAETLAYPIVAVGAAIGLAVLGWRNKPARFILLLALTWSALHPLVITARRFRLPLVPFFTLLAAYAICRMTGPTVAQDDSPSV